MSNRYKAVPTKRFIHGSRLFEVIDTQTDKCVYDSIFESQCVFKAKQLNNRERAYPGGHNKRQK